MTDLPPLTAAERATLERRHHCDGAECVQCVVLWPCDAARLLAEVQRLTAERDEARRRVAQSDRMGRECYAAQEAEVSRLTALVESLRGDLQRQVESLRGDLQRQIAQANDRNDPLQAENARLVGEIQMREMGREEYKATLSRYREALRAARVALIDVAQRKFTNAGYCWCDTYRNDHTNKCLHGRATLTTLTALLAGEETGG